VSLYRPPRPLPRRMFSAQSGDLLQRLSTSHYRREFVSFEQNGVPVLIVNKPSAIKEILSKPVDLFPKTDLMVDAFERLFGDGLLISNGQAWHRQRAILEPAFAKMRVRRIYPLLYEAIQSFKQRLLAKGTGAVVSLESEFTFFALDVILRIMFSVSAGEEETEEIFSAYFAYQKHASGGIAVKLFGGAASEPSESDAALLASSGRIREFIGRLVDLRLAPASEQVARDDVMQALLDAQLALNGSAATRDEIINQLVVLFVAGHEPVASALTWSFFILSQQPEHAAKVRIEAERVIGGNPLEFNDVNKLTVAHNVFREVLRLYPTAAFITRIARETTMIDGHKIEAGTLIAISPWLVHRHRKYWKNPDEFDPDRFSAKREHEIEPGAYFPFGQGARACIGRIIAMTEGPLLLAELAKVLRFVPLEPGSVMPTLRLTVRPTDTILCRIEHL
jgi:cytochrome P450